MKASKYVCQQCSKAFTRATILRDHIHAHQGKRPFKCEWDECDRAFTRSWDLKSHIRTHGQSAPYKCGGCGVGFQRRRDVSRHQMRKKGSRCRIARTTPTRTDEEVEAAGTLAELKNDDLEPHGEAAERRNVESIQRQRQHMQSQLRPVAGPAITSLNPTTAATWSFIPAALLAQYPALRDIDWSSVQVNKKPDEHVSHARSEQLLCPLKADWDQWVAKSSTSAKSKRLQCQSNTGTDVSSLQEHLRSDHNLHALCMSCNRRLCAGAEFRWYAGYEFPCQDRGLEGLCALNNVPAEFITWRDFCQLELPQKDDGSKTKIWFLLLRPLSPKPLRLRGKPGSAESAPLLNSPDGSNVAASHLETSQRSSLPKRLPCPTQASSVYNSLTTANANTRPLFESECDVTWRSVNSSKVMYAPADQSTLGWNAQRGGMAWDPRHDTTTLLDSTTADLPLPRRGVDSSSYDGNSTPEYNLLKVITDVTKFLQGRRPRSHNSQTDNLRISRCQWIILELFIARLDEVAITDPGVTLAHTDALWRGYDEDHQVFRYFGLAKFDKKFDKIMDPLLDWRRSGPMGRVMSKWVDDFKMSMKSECVRTTCPCERYLEMLQPLGECVTVLHDHRTSDTGYLSLVAGDKIRLISRHAVHYWEGQCIRTGQIGHFAQGYCA